MNPSFISFVLSHLMKPLRWIPAIIWTFFIAFLCLVPRIGIYPPHWTLRLHPDKWVHFTMFFILACFVFIGMGAAYWKRHRRIYIMIVLALALYGGLLELAQGLFTVTRDPEFFDFLADTIGALAGWLLMLRLTRNVKPLPEG